jgi:L-lactate dehydrogenase (cytochrome)
MRHAGAAQESGTPTKASVPDGGVRPPASREAPPRSLARCFSLDDMEAAARRHLPRRVFGYVASAAETGAAFRANREDFSSLRFVPRGLRTRTIRNQSRNLFGQTFDRPFGIAPMGLSALVAYDGDVALARAARDKGTFAIMSASSLTPLERVATEAGSRWFQAYFPGDRNRVLAMTDRIASAGFETLVVTIDVQMNGKREDDLRNGWQTPLQPSLRLAAEGIAHPRWLVGTALRTLRHHGMPHFENLDTQRGLPILARNLLRSFAGRESLSWDHVKAVRERWRGRLVLKGVLSPQDATLARQIGCDGIIVSNHGGRQMDGALSPLAALPRIMPEIGEMAVMMDSGFRRGADVLRAIALGVDFVFLGRPFLFAAAVAGEPGTRYAIDVLSAEIDRGLALLGANTLEEITPDLLARPDGSPVPTLRRS